MNIDECVEIIKQQAIESGDTITLEAIERIHSMSPSILEDICEACGRPSTNFEIHEECRKWWNCEDKEMCDEINRIVNEAYEARKRPT